jgi:hypothetical protein
MAAQNSRHDDKPYNSRGFFVLEPNMKLTQLNDKAGLFLGSKLDFVIFDNYEVGLRLHFLSNKVSLQNTDNVRSGVLTSFYGGIESGYRFLLSETNSIYASFLIGHGFVTSRKVDEHNFWVIEPALSFGHKLNNWLEVKTGVNYRYSFIDSIYYQGGVIGFVDRDIPFDFKGLNFEFGARFYLSEI